jgi:EF hand
MKTILACIAAAGIALTGAPAFAQSDDSQDEVRTSAIAPDQSFAGVDTDRNGLVSWPEFNLVFPDYSEEQFNAADLDADGRLNADEFDSLVIATGSIRPVPGALAEPFEPMDEPDTAN